MGRPRKRTRVEELAGEQNQPPAVSVNDDSTHLPGAIPTPNMSHVHSGLETLPFPSFDDPYLMSTIHQPIAIHAHDTAKQADDVRTTTHTERVNWVFGDQDLMTPINFGPSHDQSPHEKVLETGLFQLPTPESESNSPISKSCSCLASLYLALAAVQELSPDIAVALRTFRGASVTALSVLRCPVCGLVDPTQVGPPMKAFQSMMLLGTLLPVIADGYRQLLDVIERDTAAAQAAGKKQDFTLEAYGGMGMMMCGEAARCCSSDIFRSRDLEPLEWRVAVRALLRADVYGIDAENTGLKGLIVELEERQEERHRHLDAKVKAGVIDGQKDMICPAQKDRLCKSVTAQAKRAIDALVVP